MIRPIDANALKDAAETCLETSDAFKDLIDQQPSLECRPIKHAHWIEDEGMPFCSNCGRSTMDTHNKIMEMNGHRIQILSLPDWCGFCGAKMDEEVQEKHE